MIEIDTFGLAGGTDRQQFLDADRRVQVGFAYQQPGLVRRTTASGAGGEWVVVTVWASDGDADAAAARAAADPAVAAFDGLVDPASRRIARYTQLD